MPVQPTLIEQLAFRFDIAPGAVLDYLGALGLQAVCMGERLGVFELLRQGPCSETSIASRLGLDKSGAPALLNALGALGYVTKENGHYALSAMASKWMPQLRSGMRFFQWMAFDGWLSLEATMRGEVAAEPQHGQFETLEHSDRLDGSLSNSRLSADEIAKRVKIPSTAHRLLDIGGGSGLYAVKICQRNPQLKATVLDHESVLAQTREVLQAEGLVDRVQCSAGDFWHDNLGQDYDVVLLFNLLNGYPNARKIDLLRRAAETMNKSGMLIVLDQMRVPTLRGTAKAMVELTNLRLFHRGQGDTYLASSLSSWMDAAGLRLKKTSCLRGAPWMCFAVAVKYG
jgi:2-polyprenyl-3-methyl-5-hydroxy-6-metoxy-1,4-benzoquinol methylase